MASEGIYGAEEPSSERWSFHSAQAPFIQELDRIIGDCSMSLDEVIKHLDSFLLREARRAGVVREAKSYKPHNPNQVCKSLAPWFTESCKLARKSFLLAKRSDGSSAESTRSAFKSYRRLCSQAKA